MRVLKDRVRQQVAGTGTGPVRPVTSMRGFRTFAAAGIGPGDSFPMLIQVPSSGDWELSTGAMLSDGTIGRTLVSSSTGALINLPGEIGMTAGIVIMASDVAGSGGGTGPGGPYYPSFTAGGTVNGHRALMAAAGGTVVHADLTSPAYAFVGLSTQAGTLGSQVAVAVEGQTVQEPSWSWSVGQAVFVASGGLLTATAPVSGIAQQIAVAVAADTILIQPGPQITRA